MGLVLSIVLLVAPPATTHHWAQVSLDRAGRRYWQALAPRSVFEIKDPLERDAELQRRVRDADAREANGGGCPAGMVRVKGLMPDSTQVVARQNAACEDAAWRPQYLCTKFDERKLALPPARAKPLDTCVDRYEFPNVPGEFPGVLLSFDDGMKICASQGKHLCTEDEWTFACEGERALPYPYGYSRYVDPSSRFPDHVVQGDGCNIDVIRHGLRFDPKRMLKNKWSVEAVVEIDRLWAGTRAGERAKCVSPFGVYDITGNVEEWVDRSGSSHRSVLKGGYWSPVESRCQPGNAFHGPGHAYYQTGFRCCAPPL
ncbi:MAG: SUMF1/EgtB/PvdO family nonheme iron enzyme [Deltaproteobacteria bacterium]|nr:SUMF1/EgtB/PvdO family nonheme iron enzyme [Deltaproteobacteria bacterium]